MTLNDLAPTPEFETDLDPQNGWPRIRFNFENGWSASLVVRTRDGFHAMQATVAACPTGDWGTGKSTLGPSEATADEAIEWLNDVRRGLVVEGQISDAWRATAEQPH